MTLKTDTPEETTGITAEERQRLWDEMDQADGEKPTVKPIVDEESSAPSKPVEREPTAEPAAEAAEVAGKGPASDEPKAAEEAADDAQQEDPYAGLPQVIKDELAGLKSQVESLNKRTRQAEGKLGELNGKLQQTAARQVRAAGGDAPSASEIREAQGDAHATKQLLEDYPEFGAAMIAALNEQLEQRLARQQPAPEREQAPAGVSPADLARLRAEMRIERVHEGWQETVASPAFDGWMQRQQREVQMLAESTDPADAIRLLDLYVESRKARHTQQQAQHSAAAIPSGKPATRSARGKPVEEMTREEYWNYLDQIDKASPSG
jgi:hypothetical protein